MTTINSESRSRTKRGLLRALGIAVAAASVMALTAAPALAEQKCTGQVASNVCLSIDRIDSDHYRVHLGIDFHISQQRAQEIIDAPGDPFSARIFGHSWWPVGNQPMFSVPMTDLGASADSGLSADFYTTATREQLNQKYLGYIPVDRIFGRIELKEPNGGPTLTFDTRSFRTPF